jgi:acyl-CoA dehydrogenase family member 9
MIDDGSFVKGLFGGTVAEVTIFPYPEPSRAAVGQVLAALDGLRRFSTKSIDSERLDREGSIPASVLTEMRELGLFGLLVPAEYGGAAMSLTGYARVVQELAGADAALALTIAAHQSPGVASLLQFASDDLKNRLLPKMARGETLAAFALTEAGAGSDAAAIQTRADRDGDEYVLTGEKIWVTNGEHADVFTVFARTSPAEDGAKPRLTAFVVERGPGVVSGENDPKLGIRAASTTWVKLDGVRVPVTHVLGEVGRGFRVAMEALTHARLGQAASCVGSGKRLLRMCIERVNDRRAFGRPLSGFGLIKDKITRMTADLFALESMTYLTTGLVDGGSKDFAMESAICKVFGAETLWRIANHAQQVAAGAGYMQSMAWERLLRDARVHMAYQGTNEILRCFVALSGMQDPGRELEEVSKAMREPIKGFGLLSDMALRKAKSALFPERRERLARAHPTLAREAVLLEEYTAHLTKGVDKVLRRHGKNIAEMQYTQTRIANVAIDLYAIAAVLSRTTRAIERRGEEGARRELDLTSVFVGTARKRLADNIASLDENDDELRKAIASKTCADGGYPLDVI